MDQLTVVNSHSDRWIPVLEKDPVRPHISHFLRVASNRECFVIHDGIMVKSVLCAAYIGSIPKTEDELFADWSSFNYAVFYSVWSFGKGYGSKIIDQALIHTRWNRRYVTRAVTLSPKTEMARGFHLANGAVLARENPESYNFEYLL